MSDHSLYAQLRSDIVIAVKARDADKALVLRTIDGAIQRVAIDQNIEITDELVVTTLRKAVKDLQGAIEQFSKGGRQDLVDKNTVEIALLEVYLPKQMDATALDALVSSAIVDSGATSMKEMGKVMGLLKSHPEAPLIDFGAASKIIRAKLG